MSSKRVYPKVVTREVEPGQGAITPNPSFPDMEEAVLKYWDVDDTFNKSVERNPSGDHSDNEFVFFDGPPFANGLPHYGHLLTGYAKDVIPRYQTMKGRLRLGHPWPTRRAGSGEGAGHREQEPDRRDGSGRLQRRLPHVRAQVHQ